jgi:hypothetical protein
MEVTMIWRKECKDGWVAAAPRGVDPPFLEPYVYTPPIKFVSADTHFDTHHALP